MASRLNGAFKRMFVRNMCSEAPNIEQRCNSGNMKKVKECIHHGKAELSFCIHVNFWFDVLEIMDMI